MSRAATPGSPHRRTSQRHHDVHHHVRRQSRLGSWVSGGGHQGVAAALGRLAEAVENPRS